MTARLRWAIAGVAAGVVFAVGYGAGVVVPGGGETSAQDITDFYASTGKRTTAVISFLVLVVGCFLMVWFFTELWARLPEGILGRVGYHLAVFGAALVVTGTGIMLGPTGVQVFSGAEFVGVNVAHALAQAGLGVMLFGGMYAFAVAVFLLSLAARRAGVLPAWVATTGLVVGVLLLGSVIWLPGLLLPIWVIVVGLAGAREAAVTTPTPS
jgi:hypothetical protein